MEPPTKHMFAAFSRNIQTFAKDTSFQYLTDLANENIQLRETSKELDCMNDGNIKTIAKLHDKLEEAGKGAKQSRSVVETLKKASQDLERERNEALVQVSKLNKDLQEQSALAEDTQKTMNRRQDIITELKQQLSQEKRDHEAVDSAQKELLNQLQVLQKDFDAAKSSLDEYTKLTQEVVTMPKNTIVELLDRIMSAVRSLVVAYFSVDLEPEALTKISNTPVGKRPNNPIPLSSSNSPEAKYMRMAASFNVIAEVFDKYIFKSTYLLGDNSFCRILSDLAETDPAREAHIRAVFLPVRVERQLVKKRIDNCVEEISTLIGPMTLKSDRQGFSLALKGACTQVCDHWEELQKLKGRFEVSFDPTDVSKWTLLSTDIQQTLRRRDSSASSSNANGLEKQGVQQVELSDVGPVIWPSFIFKSAHGQATLQNCVVLSLKEVDRARSEQGIHREKRMAARREIAGVASSKESKAEKPFLSGDSVRKPNGG